jgi:type IV pilus assembly protein PilC
MQMGNSIEQSFLNTKSFSSFFINMVKAGEVSGNLDKIFNNLSDYYDKENKLKSKIINMLIYPIILTITSVVITLFIIIFIIPNFQKIFDSNGVQAPTYTKIIINISTFIRDNLFYLLIILAIISIFIYHKIKNDKHLRETLFNISHIGELIKVIVSLKFSRSLYILLSSGVQIIEALEISSDILESEYIKERMEISIEYVNRGNSIGNSLELSNIFPALFISMIKIGEESGRLESILNVINKYYENELDLKIEKFMSYVQPTIIIFLGLIIGVIVISMVMPMFDIINAI